MPPMESVRPLIADGDLPIGLLLTCPLPGVVAEVVPEGEGGPIASPAGNVPLKALPVEPLDTTGDPAPLESEESTTPAEQRPMRALPVGDDEVIEENVEEPNVEEP